jgi:hypothetical protein
MTVNNFIPVIWAGEVLLNLHKKAVWTQPGVINRDYEGDISDVGDSVRVSAIGPVTIGKYQKNTRIGLPQVLTDAGTLLPIDQGDFFNFGVDDVDKRQASGNLMEAGMYESGYGFSDSADRFVAGFMYANAAPQNVLGTDSVPITGFTPSAGFTTLYDNIVQLGVLLDVANVPSEDRFIIVPPWAHGLLRRDLRFVGYGTPPNLAVLQAGVIGEASGFTVLKSNNVVLTNGTTYNIVAGHPMATTFADDIVKVEAYRHPELFADAVKGLHVYGAKVLRPQALAVLKALAA